MSDYGALRMDISINIAWHSKTFLVSNKIGYSEFRDIFNNNII